MGIIYVMLFVSLLIAMLFLGAYLWATKSGQFDDDYTPSVRMLFDDGVIKKEEEKLEEAIISKEVKKSIKSKEQNGSREV
ncbi:MAG TPA: cbb3-type cytochrome oxidase assembly protein CcoS [Brumimicrobium sp.]|nr:cbb3-type cytochrome oxidase assembly protein CcoS [Brumimicrobium sp.]